MPSARRVMAGRGVWASRRARRGRRCVLLVALACSCAPASVAFAAPPPNDDFEDAISVQVRELVKGPASLGGGVRTSDTGTQIVDDSYPRGTDGWEAHVSNFGSSQQSFTVFVICTSVDATS
jgi:hypothetical protein